MRKIFLLLLLALGHQGFAQLTNLSPYSRFGIGDPVIGEFTSQFGMAGTGVAIIDGLHVNPNNPAAHSFLSSPVFELGIQSQRLQVSSVDAESQNSNSRLNHFAVGFPMWAGKWGAAFGLKPFSTVGYNNTVSQYSPSLDTTYTAEYIGDGGTNQIFVNLSREFNLSEDTSKYNQNNQLSLGLGFNYLFGSTSTERNTIFPLNSGFVSTRIEDATTLNDVLLDAGMLLRVYTDRKNSEEDRKSSALTLGAHFSAEGELSGRKSRNVFSYVENLSGVEFPRDSITEFIDKKGTITLPSFLTLGLSYELYILNESRDRQRKLILGIDYKTSDWTALKENFDTETSYSGMGLAEQQSIGISYYPQIGVSKGSRGNLFRLSTYRLGYRQGTSHLLIDNQEIKESGMSFGMSIPLLVGGRKITDTQFDFGLAYEKRGSTENGLLEEQGIRVMFGFSFHPDNRFDQWFRKRKYN